MLPHLALGFITGSVMSFAFVVAPGAESMPGQSRAVVELFTSQGCSQCPPADALLTSLAERGDVVALAYHVDYWDYIGWEDTFAHKGFSDRQRAYAKSWGSSRIYTPQMVVNGSEGVVGSRREEVQDALASAQLPLAVSLTRQGDMLKVEVPADEMLDDAQIWLVRYLDRADVAIAAGENAGKNMVYTKVVTDKQILGMWEARTGAEIKLPLAGLTNSEPGNNGLAVLVQNERNGLPGPILGAATYRF
ncbi:DUF1223 domain-containing protein [Devosia sp. YIM 151766]|uniref:DUF1223 domain-containing protein n=1 Tax=Devosia sp. YIM 151766 TaxID=3017325 RepID=UPI00255C4AA3|nr:DUF1223 domain-containing protein [Devosia sp. YIM 151766]WIY52797.1 DUF1223 domain-containing protein [Devosia sp. YIM 151766]